MLPFNELLENGWEAGGGGGGGGGAREHQKKEWIFKQILFPEAHRTLCMEFWDSSF